jgi:hypothetical protein
MTDASDFQAAREVLNRHREELTSRFHALGTGIGKDGGKYIFTVYLRAAEDVPDSEVLVEGFRVNFEVTGEFQLHNKRTSD